MKRMSCTSFIVNASSLLLRTLRGSFLIILASFYFLSTSQTTIISPLASAKKITVTHSHSHADDHEHDRHEHEDHDPKDSHKESSTHSHTVIVFGSPAAYTSPEYFPFVGITI
jgi:ABC-type nickel/cobalt efflux system permease component RcnA